MTESIVKMLVQDKVKPKVRKPQIQPVMRNIPAHESVYELTLTIPPTASLQELLDGFNKIIASKRFGVLYYEACLELTQEGVPHVHSLLYSSKKMCDASKIKSSGLYAHRYELKKVRSILNYINYIKKESGNPIIQEYCRQHAVPQFWSSDGLLQEEAKLPQEEVLPEERVRQQLEQLRVSGSQSPEHGEDNLRDDQPGEEIY